MNKHIYIYIHRNRSSWRLHFSVVETLWAPLFDQHTDSDSAHTQVSSAHRLRLCKRLNLTSIRTQILHIHKSLQYIDSDSASNLNWPVYRLRLRKCVDLIRVWTWTSLQSHTPLWESSELYFVSNVRVCVCVCIYIYIYISYTYTYIQYFLIYIYIYIYIYYTHIRIYIRVHVYMYVYMCVCTCLLNIVICCDSSF